MATILEVLKTEIAARVTIVNRWLVIESYGTAEFVVYESKYGTKKVTEVYRGTNEAEACRVLVNK